MRIKINKINKINKIKEVVINIVNKLFSVTLFHLGVNLFPEVKCSKHAREKFNTSQRIFY